MSIQNLLKQSSQILKNKSTTPIIDSEVFLCETIKKEKEFILANPNFEISKSQEKKFWEMVERRKKCEPVAYIINKKEFFGLEFYVDKNTLIPRPETEMMVEEAIKIVGAEDFQPLQSADVIDVGTGSGCIVGAIAFCSSPLRRGRLGGGLIPSDKIKSGNRTSPYCVRHSFSEDGPPLREGGNLRFFALDSNPDSLKIAKKNFNNLGLPIKTLQGDLLKPYLEKIPLCLDGAFGEGGHAPLYKGGKETTASAIPLKIILANLPYLNADEYKNAPCDVKKYEPKAALYGGLDGMKYINRLLKQIKDARLENYILILEISPSQAKYFGDDFEIKKDLFGVERIAIKIPHP